MHILGGSVLAAGYMRAMPREKERGGRSSANKKLERHGTMHYNIFWCHGLFSSSASCISLVFAQVSCVAASPELFLQFSCCRLCALFFWYTHTAQAAHNAQKDQTSSFAGAARSKPARAACRVHHTAAFLICPLYTMLHTKMQQRPSSRAKTVVCSLRRPAERWNEETSPAMRFLIFLCAAATAK